jgi:hypothetical protein
MPQIVKGEIRIRKALRDLIGDNSKKVSGLPGGCSWSKVQPSISE